MDDFSELVAQQRTLMEKQEMQIRELERRLAEASIPDAQRGMLRACTAVSSEQNKETPRLEMLELFLGQTREDLANRLNEVEERLATIEQHLVL